MLRARAHTHTHMHASRSGSCSCRACRAGLFGASAGTWAKYAKIMFLLGIVGDIVRSSAPSLRLVPASGYVSLSCPPCVAVCVCVCDCPAGAWAVVLRGATPRRRQEAGGGAACGCGCEALRHAAEAARHGSPAHLNAASDSSCGRGGVPGLLCRGVLAVHDAAVGAALHRAVGPAAAGCLLHAPPPVQGPGLRESFATMSPLLAPRVTVKRLA